MGRVVSPHTYAHTHHHHRRRTRTVRFLLTLLPRSNTAARLVNEPAVPSTLRCAARER